MTDNDITIRTETAGNERRYLARVAGVDGEAALALSLTGPGLVIAAHTAVPDTMAGRGVGRALVAHLVSEARAGGFQVIALCPFVQAQMRRHPEWQDVLRG